MLLENAFAKSIDPAQPAQSLQADLAQKILLLFKKIYGTKVKTLHIYSSSKIALILLFRNKMKSQMKISFLAFTCSKYMYSSSANYALDILSYKKEIKIKKKAFRPF